MKHLGWLLLSGISLFLMAALWPLPSASPWAQVSYATPTALPDGRILYIVQPQDTCIRISLLTGVSIDDLRLLNGLDANCTLREGQSLLLGTVAPTPTPFGPTETPTPLLPSPTPFQGNGRICVLLFNDINGNALVEEGEAGIAGGAISITDRLGRISREGVSQSGTEPVCFDDLPEGDYNISVAIPEGYNPTTRMNYALTLRAGDTSTLDFGAQLSSRAQPGDVTGVQRSPLLAILGAVLLLLGVGLGVYARFVLRR
ncbi:LysM peptidoglycan-binding domain-containing protein [uncultured Thermanaerothrix sp.]|uniref:SdrD B-like domain and LysM peptidoglycan-binding domain-containing protein n=1 Tax=uncultured Thermanaerothrix sp. TaxID=1195149 RepID=UPI0026358252|nr:LysM peptidoglycan-binding domain-containing protein [uncultured Thermanaerothrix sp.]